MSLNSKRGASGASGGSVGAERGNSGGGLSGSIISTSSGAAGTSSGVMDVMDANAQDQEVYQAVIMADSFNERFGVLCEEEPRYLLPLLNVPLLSWTLEALLMSNVKDVVVFCGKHGDAVRDFVASTPYAKTMSIQPVSAPNTFSIGDALRAVDAMGVVDSKRPFLLLHGPIVGNVDLGQLIRKHEKIREQDRNVIMTIGCARGGRPHPEAPIMLVDPTSSQLLHYIPHSVAPHQSRAHFPSSLILDSKNPQALSLEVWAGPTTVGGAGVRDLGIDVCAYDVCAEFSENFDWMDVRRDMVRGVLQNELLGKKLGVALIGEESEDAKAPFTSSGTPIGKGSYVERIKDPLTYEAVSRDLLMRRAFPLTPESGIMTEEYESRRGGVYVAKGVRLARSATVIGPSLLGPSSVLGSRTRVARSVLGAQNIIGSSSTVSDSYLFDKVRIGTGCRLERCIIGSGCVIGDGAVIGKGAMIAGGTEITKGARISPYSRIGSHETEDSEPLTSGSGHLWPSEGDIDSDAGSDIDPYENPANRQMVQLGRRWSISSDRSFSSLSHASEDDAESVASTADLLLTASARDFSNECRLTLERGLEENLNAGNLAIELTTLVLSSNVSMTGPDGALGEIVSFVMELIDLSAGQIGQQAQKVWVRWGELVAALKVSPLALLLEIQRFAAVQDTDYAPFTPLIFQALYNADVVEDTDLFEWYQDPAARGASAGTDSEKGLKDIWAKNAPLIRRLQEMQDESSEEEDEEDED